MKHHLLCTGLLSLKIMGTYVAILYRIYRSFHNLKKLIFIPLTVTSNRTFFPKNSCRLAFYDTYITESDRKFTVFHE